MMIPRKIIRSGIKNCKRGVSPIIAVILLIGLAVAASAIVFFIVLPMFEAEPELTLNEATLIYDTDTTKENGKAWGKFSLNIFNDGKGEGEITGFNVKYKNGTDYIDTGTDIEHFYEFPIEIKAADYQDLSIYFELVPENADNDIYYQINIAWKGGTTLKSEALSLESDRPEITSFSVSDDEFIRRTVAYEPTITDQEIKNVSYYLDANRATINNPTLANYTATSYPWDWSWASYNYSAKGLDNGNHNVTFVVWDYAGWNRSNTVNYTLDNDYTKPKIWDFNTYLPYSNNTVELGTSTVVRANVTDTGCQDSQINSVYLWYKISSIGDLTYPNGSISMTRIGVSDIFQGNIPSTYAGLSAWNYNMTYWIQAIDVDSNMNDTANDPNEPLIIDSYSPDISHTPIDSSYYRDAIEITAEITDPGGVAIADLWYRSTNDTVFSQAPLDWSSETMENSTGNFTFTIPYAVVQLDGIDYFINATDTTGGPVAYDGNVSSPWHISVIDDWDPYVYQSANVTSGVTGNALQINALTYDNDASYANDSALQTGRVSLYYRQGESGAFTKVDMTPESYDPVGYTTLGFKITRWTQNIPSDQITFGQFTYYYLEAKDQAFQWPTYGYNGTFYWGTEGNPIKITVSAQTTPIIARSSNPEINVDGDLVTYHINVTGQSCDAVQIKTYWGNGTSVGLTDIWIAGLSVWPGGTTPNDTWVDITDKPLGIGDYEIQLYFNTSVFNTQISNVFNTTDAPFKIQDPITFLTPSKTETEPSFAFVSATKDGRRGMYVAIRNDGAAVTVVGCSLSWSGGGSKSLDRIDMGTSTPNDVAVHNGNLWFQTSPLTVNPYDTSSFNVPGSSNTFFIYWRYRLNDDNLGNYNGINIWISGVGSPYAVSSVSFSIT